jgi:3-methyladenine DNA glycosylase/8-oxoguanine DNA glycosylase
VGSPWAEELRVTVRPAWTFRLPRGGGMDGVMRRRGSVLERAVWVGDEPVVVRIAQPRPDQVVFGARSADRDAAVEGLRRARLATGVDVDLRSFYDHYRDDPLIGASVRSRPHLRPNGRPEPFEAFAWAVCEQLIEYVRAVEIERRIIRRFGRHCPSWDGMETLMTPPSAQTVAGLAPAELQALDLSGGRARALIKAAREVAAGRVDLHAPSEQETGWQRLRAITGIGSWTIAVLALHGQQRYDQLPAGDLAYLKWVGQLLRPEQGPSARAEVDEVNALFEPYARAGWAGLAGLHALGRKASGGGAGVRFAA